MSHHDHTDHHHQTVHGSHPEGHGHNPIPSYSGHPAIKREDRDGPARNPEEVSQESHYAMYAVFSTPAPLLGDLEAMATAADQAVTDRVTVRGWYDISGFRAEADVMGWFLADDPRDLQAAYHAFRSSDLGCQLEPVWSCVAVHRPSEFNSSHIPQCFDNRAPRPWLCVYPFVRSYDWYYMAPEKRRNMLAEHGRSGREYPDVLGSTMSAFGLNDYEWILAFEADELHRIVDAMRHQREVEARLHVREEIPFFTGPRVRLVDWVATQPHE